MIPLMAIGDLLLYFSLLPYMDYMERNKSNQSISLLYRTLHAIIKINNIDLDVVKIQGLIKEIT